jgi:centromere/kinetochore protein ZW10
MSSQVSDEQLGDALLQSIEHGTFPQDEQVASAPVPSSALPKLLEVVSRAREDTKNEVCSLSREAAADVDGWIAQARKLQDDIKRSQDTAKDIVQQAEEGKKNTASVQDAASKVGLLHTEIAYNESLARVVGRLRDISILLDSAEEAAVHGKVLDALDTLQGAKAAFKETGPFEATRPVSVLRTKEEQLKQAIVETVTESWNGLVFVDNSNYTISLKDSIVRESVVDIDTVVEALKRLNLLDTFITRFSRDFDRIILSSRLAMGSDKVVTDFEINGDDIRLTDNVNDGKIKATVADIQSIAEYLNTRLPSSVAIPLSSKLVPVLSARLINNLLLPAVPTSTSGVEKFQETLSYALGLVEFFDELGWSGQERLTEWVDKSAEIWLAKQKEAAITKVQTQFQKWVQEKKTVERAETQVVSKGDALHGGQDEHDDDWSADWAEDESTTEQGTKTQNPEEEDMSAWGEEVDEAPPEVDDPAQKPAEDEDADDWGADWDDDEGAKPASATQHAAISVESPKLNGRSAAHKSPKAQEVTLRETYTVTAMPDSIIEIILQVVADVATLNSPDLVTSAIAPASGGLYAIPSLLLTMYRATAAVHYAVENASNMLMYNDCQRLSDRLRAFLQEQSEKDSTSTLPRHLRPSARLKADLEDDIKTIDGFGKRAYGREMESQRQIIRDHLEGAQGFQGCTEALFSTVCDDAVATTIDRISDVKRQWQNVLSHSALLQSLGSLVSTVINKFVNDIEDMTDIAENESKKLHGYCVSLATLSQHFLTPDNNGEARDMVSIYTPNWFKFQYLSEILDSSLADIKYFWTDGELKLEMESEEVVGLIEALFAPSDHRRRAIIEIRRTSMR